MDVPLLRKPGIHRGRQKKLTALSAFRPFAQKRSVTAGAITAMPLRSTLRAESACMRSGTSRTSLAGGPFQAQRNTGEFVTATAKAVKSAAPESRIFAGSLVRGGLDYLSQMFDTGCYKYIDAITYHHYKARHIEEDVKEVVADMKALAATYNPNITIIQGEHGRPIAPRRKRRPCKLPVDGGTPGKISRPQNYDRYDKRC